MILAVTAQDAEVIKFAQIDGNISLVLRSTDDCQPREPVALAQREPVRVPGPSLAPLSPCPVVTTTGVTLRKLVDDFGVLPAAGRRGHPADPVPAGRSVGTRSAAGRDPQPASATRWAGAPPAHRRPIHPTSTSPPATETHGRPDPRPHRRRHPGDPRSPLEAAWASRSDIEVVGSAASGREAIEMAREADAGRRPHGHQHAGHGRHLGHGTPVRRGARPPRS